MAALRILLLALLLAPAAAHAELAQVWAVSDGIKIPRSVTAHPLAAGNEVFDAAAAQVRLFAVRGETVAFQVIAVAGNAAANVSVTLESIGPLHNRGATSDPDRYFVGRTIEIFAAHYVPVTVRSHDLVWKPGSDAEPDDLIGMLPDPLVPHRRPIYVAANTSQSVWIDVWVPPSTPAGTHRGVLEVSEAGVPCKLRTCRLEVVLEVLPDRMPDALLARNMVWFSGGPNERNQVPSRFFADPEQVSDEAILAVADRYIRLAKRHRITLFIGQFDTPSERLRARLSGEAFTPANGYEGPGQGVAQDIYSLKTYGGALEPSEAAQWHRWLAEHAAGVEAFLYAWDEPKHTEKIHHEIERRARAAEPLSTLVTTAYDPTLNIDIFVSPPQALRPADLAAAKQREVRLWTYNGTRPHAGSFAIDDVAISPRVNPWIQARYGVPRWFYWEASYYDDFQGDRAQVDVFATALNFTNRFGDEVNGDGLLIYPGRDHLFPNSDQHFEGPLPSMRLKNWRRGIEDAQYLAMVRAAGHGAFVDRLVRLMVPRALADGLAADEPVSWPEDGEAWLRARRALWQTLATGQPPPLEEELLARPPEARWKRFRRALGRALDPLLRSPKRRLVSAAALLVVVAVALLMWRRRR